MECDRYDSAMCVDLGHWWQAFNWGSVPDWVAAIGTVGALGLAAFGYVWSVMDGRKAQARKVVIGEADIALYEAGQPFFLHQGASIVGIEVNEDEKTGGWGKSPRPAIIATMTIANNSDEAVGPMVFEVVSGLDQALIDGAAERIVRIPPGSAHTVKFMLEHRWGPTAAHIQGRIVFRDAAGRWWQRFENEPVRRAPRSIRPTFQDAGVARELRRKKTKQTMV